MKMFSGNIVCNLCTYNSIQSFIWAKPDAGEYQYDIKIAM